MGPWDRLETLQEALGSRGETLSRSPLGLGSLLEALTVEPLEKKTI